jgi:hypothetical protein
LPFTSIDHLYTRIVSHTESPPIVSVPSPPLTSRPTSPFLPTSKRRVRPVARCLPSVTLSVTYSRTRPHFGTQHLNNPAARFLLSISVALHSTTPAAAMSRTAAPTGAKTRLMSEMKALRKETWIHFQDVGSGPDPHLCAPSPRPRADIIRRAG